MAIAESFLEGNRRVYTATFKVPDETGDLTDPTTVTFYRRKLGSGSLTSLESWVYGTDSEVQKTSVGVFTFTIGYQDDGRYVIGAGGTGTCEAYDEIDVEVLNAKARA
jgi:hypothetical protein